jgi:Mce-associated membrane protein
VAKVAGGSEKAGGGRRTWRGVPVKAWLVRATVAVAVVGSAVTAGLQWHAADQAAQRDQERQEVRASAAEFGVALLSYDHTKLQDARHRVLDLASDDFAKTYDEAFTGGLEGVISKLKADATAEVQSVYLEKIEEGTAKAVVVVDSEVHSTAGTRRVRGSYLDMKLVRRGGEWKVTDVTSVGAANESMTDPQGNQQTPGGDAPAPKKSP